MRSLIVILAVVGMFLTSAVVAADGSVELEVDAETLLGDKLNLDVSGADFGSLVGSGEFKRAGWSAIPLNIVSSEISAGNEGTVRVQLVDDSEELIIVISLGGGIKVVVKDIPSGDKLANFKLGKDELEIEIEIDVHGIPKSDSRLRLE